MKLTHKLTDTWTTSDGTIFFNEQQAKRYTMAKAISASVSGRFAVALEPNHLLPPMTVGDLTELILFFTFDEPLDAVSVTKS
jgi:hypothetical protein